MVSQVTRSRPANTWIIAASSALLAVVACSGTGSDSAELPEQTLFLITLDTWRAALDDSQTTRALTFVANDFRHQGRDRDALALWMEDLAQAGELAVFMRQVKITLDPELTQATVAYVLEVQQCEEAAAGDITAGDDPPPEEAVAEKPGDLSCVTLLHCHSSDSARCGWATRWRRDPVGWRIVGDGSQIGLDLSLRNTATGLTLTGAVFDPGASLSSASVAFPGGDAVALERQGATRWAVPAATPVPTFLYPDTPLPWALDVDVGEGSVGEGNARSVAVHSVMDTFASSIQPQGQATAPYTFSWVLGTAARGGIELEVAADGAVIWRSSRFFADTYVYDGPPLNPGSDYQVRVVAYDLRGSSAVAGSPLSALDATDIAPRPTSLMPSTGSTTGGTELTITGQDFLVGAQVRVGPQDCIGVARVSETTLTCTTPALPEGPHDVVVVNPSGAVGLLSAAFTAL